MLRRYSIFMMVLFVGASLIGISSIYQPANVETQPQQQAPTVQQPPQILNRPGQVPSGGQSLKEQAKPLDPAAGQFIADKLLLDRLMPQIIKRIDGATILQKIDAKTLAAKVLPFLDVNVVATERPGQISVVTADRVYPFESATQTGRALASCAPDETLVTGGFAMTFGGELVTFAKKPDTNQWAVAGQFGSNGRIQSYAECLTVELALKQ
jgi:hypothetical protein